MGVSELLKIVTPDATSPPVTHEDLIKIVRQLERYEAIPFASAAERDALYATLGITPHAGALSYLQNLGRYEKASGAGTWLPIQGIYVSHVETTVGVTLSNSATEVLVNSITFTAVAGLRYRYEVNGVWYGSVVSDQLGLRVYYKAGATVDVGGTKAGGDTAYDTGVATKYTPLSLIRWLPNNLSGQYTVGLFIRKTAGTQVAVEQGAANEFFQELTAWV